MGCAPSNDPKIAVAETSRNNNHYNHNSYNNKSSRTNNGFQKVQLKNTEDNYNQYNRPNSDKKPLAFVIEFDEKKKSGNISNRPPPGRLQLEPIKNAPMTQEKLDEKMRAAERNRENILKSRVKSSKNRGSAASKQSRNNSGSLNNGSYYNNDSRKMSREYDRDYDNHDYTRTNGFNGSNGFSISNGQVNDGYQRNERDRKEEELRREKLLRKRRIVNNPASDDEIEHNKKHSDDEYF